MEEIIVDTSSILFGLSNRIDVFEKIKEQLGMIPVISKGVVKELQGLSTDKKANHKYAATALSIIEANKIRVDSDETYVDKWILSNAKEVKNVCTNDTNLRNELKSRGIMTYTLSRDGELR